MTIKVTKKLKKGTKTEYKSSKFILTSKDIQEADVFDAEIAETIKNAEDYLLRKGALSSEGKRIDRLLIWYTICKKINDLLRKNRIEKKEEQFFWDQIYNHSKLISRESPFNSRRSRNDFKTALSLTRYPIETIKKVGPWSMWRDILIYRVFLNDKRLLDWVVDYLIKNPKTVHGSRPFLKAVASRFKRMDTTFLNDEELLTKLKEIKL